MPDFPLIDTHVHLWDLNRHEYPWLEQHPALCRSFGFDDYQYHCASVTVDGVVVVEAGASHPHNLPEARWFAALAEEEPCIKGIVAAAVLSQETHARPYLNALAQVPLVKGVRVPFPRLEGDSVELPAAFLAGVRLLAEHGFTCDVCVGYRQLPAVAELARNCPSVRFMLDHMGKPDIRNRAFAPWREGIGELASLPNVFCKVSGIVTETDVATWRPRVLKPYIDHVVEAFGVTRIVYGSDWPVCTLAACCTEWVDALHWVLKGWRASDLSRLFRDNAIEFYRLKPD